MPTYTDKEQIYLAHTSSADKTGFHVDGCFYCGGNHPSDCCTDRDEVDAFWSSCPHGCGESEFCRVCDAEIGVAPADYEPSDDDLYYESQN